jgi:hypothetical protein
MEVRVMKKFLAPFLLLILLAACFAVPRGQAGQPNMRNALESLQEAQKSLNKAAHDKAGHRAKALQLVQEAIDEVKAGIRAGAE